MKIKEMCAVLGGTVLMAMAGAAGAGQLYNTTANGVATPGSYNVVIYEDSIFNFHVNSITSNASPSNTANAVKITVAFYYGVNGTGGVIRNVYTSGTAGTDTGATNWGTSTTNAGHATVYMGTPSTAILGNGSNSFAQSGLGYFILNSDGAKSMTVEIKNGTSVWYDKFNITDFGTPEASSLALLLPGLVPLGIALRRRRAAKA